MIKLIATDLDGTLLDSQKRLPADFENIMEKLSERGIRFFAASGRSHYVLRRDFSKFSHVGLICENGAFVTCDGEVLSQTPIPFDSLKKSVQLFNAYQEGLFFLMCAKAATYAYTIDERDLKKYVVPYYASLVTVKDMSEIKDDIYKVAICDKNGPENKSHRQLSAQLPEGLQLIVSGEVWMDLVVSGVSKGKALQKVQARLGISPQETMVFGDYDNDLEMFDHAYYSYAMANAKPEIKSRARFITESNDCDGVAKQIRKILINNL